MKLLTWLTQLLEYLGGSGDRPPSGLAVTYHPLLWGVWWGLLSLVIYVFCGQSSKFIYIDF
jgi:hypothetical protein